jgi:hypothetical protein
MAPIIDGPDVLRLSRRVIGTRALAFIDLANHVWIS